MLDSSQTSAQAAAPSFESWVKVKDGKVTILGSVATKLSADKLEILNENYLKDAHDVFYLQKPLGYRGWEADMSLIRIESADPASFEAPRSKISGRDEWAKDRKHVFRSGKLVHGADPASFELLDLNYSRDKTAVFLGEHKTNLDPKTAKFSEFYQWDSQNVYSPSAEAIRRRGRDPSPKVAGLFDIEPIEEIDAGTFRLINQTGWARDSKQVFYKGQLAALADSATFRLLGSGYGIDRSRVFYLQQLVDFADSSRFFSGSILMKDADCGSFQVLEHGYARDLHRFYFKGQTINVSDPSTFRVVGAEKKLSLRAFLAFAESPVVGIAEDSVNIYSDGIPKSKIKWWMVWK